MQQYRGCLYVIALLICTGGLMVWKGGPVVDRLAALLVRFHCMDQARALKAAEGVWGLLKMMALVVALTVLVCWYGGCHVGPPEPLWGPGE